MIINLEKGKDYHETGNTLTRYVPKHRRKQFRHKPMPRDFYANAQNKPRDIIPENAYVRPWVWVTLGAVFVMLFMWNCERIDTNKRLAKEAERARIVQDNLRMRNRQLECSMKAGRIINPWDIDREGCQ